MIVPQAKITVYHPAATGLTTVQGLSRDHFVNEKWQSLGGAEIIKPLHCLAPAGDLRPTTMASLWAVHASYNQALRAAILPGNPPVAGYEFYDNEDYAAGTAATTYAGVLYTNQAGDYWQPNFSLRLIRFAPPPSQGVVPQTTVTLWALVRVTTSDGETYLDRNGSWTDGKVILALPFQSPTYKNPCLAWRLRAAGTYIPDSAYFSQGDDDQSLDGGMNRTTWVFETITDTTLFDGTHIVIRRAGGGEPWHAYNENIRIIEGPLTVVMAGCRQQLVLSPITYADSVPTAVTGWAPKPIALPSAEHETTATFTPVDTTPAGWTVTAAAKDSATVQAALGYRPEVTFTPTAANDDTRPVCWLVSEDHEPTIAVPAGLPAEESTDTDEALLDLTLRVTDEWNGASGSAAFKRDDSIQYSGWLPRGKVVMNFGWQADPAPGGNLAAADVATMFIKPGGIPRDRKGEEQSGAPGLRVELCDLIEARLQETCVVDIGQAGGFTAESWFTLCGNRLGLPDSMIDVAAAIASNVLPLAKPIPSVPNLKPQDGESWESHFDTVCKASGLRWGYNPFTGKLFLDGGRPVYSPGVSTITFTIDYDTLTEADTVYEIEHVEDESGHRNRYKILYGAENERKSSYWKAEDAEIEADGADLWAVADDSDGDTVADIQADLDEEHRRQASVIKWIGPLRREFQPEQFVKVGDCPQIGLEVDSVYQISEINHAVAGRRTDLVARRVYSPGGFY